MQVIPKASLVFLVSTRRASGLIVHSGFCFEEDRVKTFDEYITL